MRRIFFLFIFSISILVIQAQTIQSLSIEKIMSDPKWMGVSPSNITWGEDSKTIYFNWNPESEERDPIYQITTTNTNPQKSRKETLVKLRRGEFIYSKDRLKAIFERNGDLFLYNFKNNQESQLTNTVERESNPQFSLDEQSITFERGENLFSSSLVDNETKQLTNFTRNKEKKEVKLSTQDEWLKQDQLKEFDIIKTRKRNQENQKEYTETFKAKRPKEIFLEEKIRLSGLQVSPDGRFISYRLISPEEGNKNTIVPNYVTESGYTENLNTRTKVGNKLNKSESFIYDAQRDSTYIIITKEIPGIKDLPDYLTDYPERLEELKKTNADRPVSFYGPYWNSSSTNAILIAYSQDNKDRWILKLSPITAEISVINRQRDEAWIGGPGISGYGSNIGWIDDHTFYFQSEETGYSHLYSYNFTTHEKKQLTQGAYEVQSVELSNDKKHFYISANLEHPGITHFYKLSTNGGNPQKLTSMKGGNEVSLSPDEKWLAIRYSYSNKPWELYLQENKAGAKAIQITNSTSEEFNSYSWKEPDMVTFKNRYGVDVHARVYKPTNPHPSKPAVVFVHGAGYLQNVHYWWSQYFREYMFNNLLADQGYTVIDIDYTASSGYGRDHRTGIYRHMGGKDLTDQVDGVKFLVDNYGVNPKNVGLYGGSYGGFITLMGLFTEPDVFKSGGALRSVTDWAHYNHGYTSNILNEPFNDEIAYRRSSPLYFAEGLKGHLLMAHGMVDINVHFQDIVRLSQRLIELGKDNWELAAYPVEDHGFVEPSSWTDEYKRVFKLFEATLKD